MKFKDYLGNKVEYGDTVACVDKNPSGSYSARLTTVVVDQKNYDGKTLTVDGYYDERRTTNIISLTALERQALKAAGASST